MAFRRNNQIIRSKYDSNYLGCLALLIKFDPFLANHIDKYANKSCSNVSYLSSRTGDEFIYLLSKTVLEYIVKK